VQCLPRIRYQTQCRPNKALQLTANPLRGLSAAELGRCMLHTEICRVFHNFYRYYSWRE
jgi:hypothetical protein